MAFDPNALLSLPPRITRQTITTRDVILYALGVGVGLGDPTDQASLRFVYERQALVALPTLAVVLAAPGFWLDDPAFDMNWRKVLNAGQDLILHAPLPLEGELHTVLSIDHLYDKGAAKGALMLSSRKLYHGETHLATISQTHILRGDGGFGGSDQPAVAGSAVATGRAPDHVVDLATRPEQALLYRLSGDLNPLHIDPEVAQAGGFPKPILHGSCTFGIAGRAVLQALCDNQPERLKAFGARFSKPVYPGETIRTEIWREGNDAAFRCRSVERDVVVLDRGTIKIAA